MPMRRDPVTGRHFQSDGIVAAGSRRVAVDHRELSARRHKWRWRSPLNAVRSECVVCVGHVRRAVGSSVIILAGPEEQGCQRKSDTEASFHLWVLHLSVIITCRAWPFNHARITEIYLLCIAVSCSL